MAHYCAHRVVQLRGALLGQLPKRAKGSADSERLLMPLDNTLLCLAWDGQLEPRSIRALVPGNQVVCLERATSMPCMGYH